MKRIVNIVLLMLLLTSCSSVLTPPEALDNCAIWQGCEYLRNDYIVQRLNDFQGSLFKNEDEIECEKRVFRAQLCLNHWLIYDRPLTYDNLKEFDEEVENFVNNLDIESDFNPSRLDSDVAVRVVKKLKGNPYYVRKSIMSIYGTKREYLDYISQHIELLEWAYDEENSTKKFDSYLAIYELREGDTFSYSSCRVTVRDDGSELYTELGHEKKYEDL